MLCFFCASWWTQDWWSDIDLCTKNAINKCLNWLIKSHSPYQLVSNLLNCLPWKSQIASQLLHYHSFGGFSTLIAEIFFFHNTSRLDEWILDSVIITTFEWEVCAWWNSKCCTYSFEQWCVIIIYVAESWVTMKSQFTLNSTHLKENPSDGEVDAKHHKQLDLFWNLIENFTRYSTACSCASYYEVELSRPITHIWPCKQSLWFYARRMLSFVPVNIPLNFASKYWFGVTKIFISLLKWLTAFSLNGTGDTSFFPSRFRVSLRGKKTSNSKHLFMSSSLCLLSDPEMLDWTPSDQFE